MAVKAEDHGARGDGVTDDGPALREALCAARLAGTVLQLRPGATYFARAEDGAEAVLVAHGRTPVAVDGQGATLLLGSPQAGALHADGPVSVSLASLTVDHTPLPFAQGLVVSVDREAGSFVARVDAGYPPLDDAGFVYGGSNRLATSFMTVFEADSRLIKTGVPDCLLLAGVQRRPDGLFDVALTHPELGAVAAGDLFVYIQREKGNAFFTNNCGQVEVQDVTVHASPGVAFVARQCEGLLVKRCCVGVPPGSDRLISTNADAVHCQGLRTGPRVLDCVFERMLDDGVNTYACPSIILRAEGARVWLKGGTAIRVGDELELSHPPTGAVIGRSVVLEVHAVPSGAQDEQPVVQVLLERVLGPVVSGEGFPGADIAVNRSACGNGFEIRGNTFRASRARAAVLRGSDGVVTGNRIEQLSLWGIEVANDSDWPEGPVPRNITISHNTFEALGRSAPSAAVVVAAVRTGREPADQPQVTGIRITGNTMSGWSGRAAITVDAAQDVEIMENDIRLAPDQVAVVLRNAHRVCIDGVEHSAQVEPVDVTGRR